MSARGGIQLSGVCTGALPARQGRQACGRAALVAQTQTLAPQKNCQDPGAYLVQSEKSWAGKTLC